MKTMSYADVAYKVLLEAQDTKMMHYKEITNRAYTEGLVESDDIIVAGNIASAINSDIRRLNSTEQVSRFVSYGKGLYGLSQNEPTGILKDIKEKNAHVKNQLLESLLHMPPFKFEELIGEVLRQLGFENIIVTQKSGDGGIDVMGELVVAGAIKNNICVQVKRWRNNVQRGSISELRGSLRPHQTGLFITTSDFSKSAVLEAKDPYKAPISLINGRELVEMLCDFGIGVVSRDVKVFDIDKNCDFTRLVSDEMKLEGDGTMEIFARYKGKIHYAAYVSPTKIIYEDVIYQSPSAAGTKVQNGLPVNGWKFWKYIDPNDGKIYPIDILRK